jgi:hypothetical protein
MSSVPTWKAPIRRGWPARGTPSMTTSVMDVSRASNEPQVIVALLAVHADEIRALARFDGAERAVPLENPGRVDRGHRHDLLRREHAALFLADEPGHLQLAQQILAAARVPSRSRCPSARRRASPRRCRPSPVQQQVAQRRPHHRAAVRGQQVESSAQGRAVDAAQRIGDRPLAGLELQAVEPAPGGRVRAFAQVLQVTRVPAQRGR